MATEYFFISDLHIGGDGTLNDCKVEEELIQLLKNIEKRTNSELIIVGDMFGFWELTKVPLNNKLDYIISSHKTIFKQFKKTGEKVKISFIVGNHDAQLLALKNAKKTLLKYNIHLLEKPILIKKINNKSIWIEHGNQYDPINRVEDFHDINSLPVGYSVSQNIGGGAHNRAEKGRKEWLHDINAVHPHEEVPQWIFSNYFYKEMHPMLRLSITPFFMFGLVSFLFLILSWAQNFDLIDFRYLSRDAIADIRYIGSALDIILYINITIILAFIFLAVPMYLILVDIRGSLKRYGFIWGKKREKEKQEKYINAAKKVFKKHPEISIFIFGHTHDPYITKIGNKIIANSGTWTKKLRRIKSWFKLFPAVYTSNYELSFLRIHSKGKHILVDKHIAQKDYDLEITPLQRFAILGKKLRPKIEKFQRVRL